MEQTFKLQGVFVSLITPFHKDEISFSELEENINQLNRTPVGGYLVLGGNSESPGMSEAERLQILKTVTNCKGDKILLASVAAESTRQAREEIQRFLDLGVDCVRVLPPHYFARSMTNEVLYRFYKELADSSPLPIILYNVPKLTGGLDFSASLVRTLAGHQQIIGIKDSSPDGIHGFIAATRDLPDFSVLAGSANNFFPALAAGAVGGDMTIANYLPELCCRLYSEFRKGNIEQARDLHLALYTINRVVSGTFGVAGIKAAMEIMGRCGGEPRRPFLPLGKEHVATVRDALASAENL